MEPLRIKCLENKTGADGSIYGKFVIEPLEKGYGTTLGNALRRVLLSSLDGSAVSAVRIEGVTHEFTTVPGVVEDVIDVMLNLKGLVVKTFSNDPQYLHLDLDRSGPVTGRDIMCPADATIINPDWQLCTLAEGGRLRAEITVERGRGYVPADAHSHFKQAIDVLPIDAVFMPIRKVAYNVEPTRVGESTDFDKLTIELWSNGSIDATEAISQAARQIVEHLLPIAELSGKPMVPAATQPQQQDGKHSSISIEELELSVRAYNCLKRANINSLGELLKLSYDDLMNIKNFGKKSADEVIERLRQFGLTLADTPKDK
ncbi:MAG: DNA-directed RNA polymerase subunit alpha [Candidatus Obscuribacter sp.]|jgi:DNA-directed RNA polymerase subunit alpha|nr:DNA-directed RNA polymerase subunit alpha [Candidatus Obscuribacter sp.]MDQ5966771.1 DNA-directed polymerase [Cyanobacteriota bacterium erpe_2018_sw_39hr_WHONDRS-SW48-000098_B_bin.30]MBK7837932.1 DNA-directed RNA polymerase subunit alpha [Candidatus Obscuribacter sp.]MBK9204788.1 DNA-directed RNA polymerase subunit alpha [Candidatus Obscuribacter sp.]MBK9618623.1 DNA-directed RNA polymerase subunit alpha [Candidatus Obscuribacter sp.]